MNHKILDLKSIINPKLDETASLDDNKNYVQKSNSKSLENYLENNPMLYTDGKYHVVATCGRNKMTQQYVSYVLYKTINPNIEDVIKWHSKGTKCTSMSLLDFVNFGQN